MVLLRKRSTEHLISTIQIKSLTPWLFFFLINIMFYIYQLVFPFLSV